MIQRTFFLLILVVASAIGWLVGDSAFELWALKVAMAAFLPGLVLFVRGIYDMHRAGRQARLTSER